MYVSFNYTRMCPWNFALDRNIELVNFDLISKVECFNSIDRFFFNFLSEWQKLVLAIISKIILLNKRHWNWSKACSLLSQFLILLRSFHYIGHTSIAWQFAKQVQYMTITRSSQLKVIFAFRSSTCVNEVSQNLNALNWVLYRFGANGFKNCWVMHVRCWKRVLVYDTFSAMHDKLHDDSSRKRKYQVS